MGNPSSGVSLAAPIKPGRLWLALGLHRATAAPAVREEELPPWKGDEAGTLPGGAKPRKKRKRFERGLSTGEGRESGPGKEIWAQVARGFSYLTKQSSP